MRPKTRCCKQGCKRGCKRSCKRTMLATKNNAGNQTHSAATLFSATCSAPHTLLLKIFKLVSSSRFSILMRHATPIKIIGNVVGLANFVNEILANAEWVHVSCLLGDDRRERSSFMAAPFSKTRLHGCEQMRVD